MPLIIQLFLSAPVYLTGDTDERNKEIFETADYMTSEDLKDFIVCGFHRKRP